VVVLSDVPSGADELAERPGGGTEATGHSQRVRGLSGHFSNAPQRTQRPNCSGTAVAQGSFESEPEDEQGILRVGGKLGDAS